MKFLKRHFKKLLILFAVYCGFLLFLFMISPVFIYFSGRTNIYTDITNIPHYQVAIVFGAGVKDDGTPSDALKDRLITAAELYDAGLVDKILVSGDNRFENYNEPEAMYQYLIDTEGIPASDIALDYAGRRTYDTCARANEIWGLDSAILISQGFHLPRAIFTCDALGVSATGFSATRQDYVYEKYYKFREILAIYKALIDIYLLPPSYVGGEVETL